MNLSSINSRANLRLRSVHPILDEDGCCSLLYDLERTFVFNVPKELRPRLSATLETGQLDETTIEWLKSEDLLTPQRRANWAQGSLPVLPVLTDISLDMSGSCNLGCVYCFENDINSRIGPMSDETAMASLEFFFKQVRDSQNIALHFGSGEPLLRFDLLKKLVAEANVRASRTKKRISYELTTNATLVTKQIAAFLRDNPFNVRVSCDGPPHLHNNFRPFASGKNSYPAVEKGLRLLIEYLPDRLTVNSVLASGARLSQLWEWAKSMGLRQYHVIKVGAYAEDQLNLKEKELHEFRCDLVEVCGDMFADLKRGLVPLNYQPITKVVRRLMIPEPITRFCGVAGNYLGVSSNGKVFPCFRHLGVKQYDFGDVWQGVDDLKRQGFLGNEAADVDSRPICHDCWARYLCGGGCYADSTVYGPDKLKPQIQHCPFWRTEIETAIRFYKQLVDIDPALCIRLFGDDPDAFLSSMEDEPAYIQRKNCS